MRIGTDTAVAAAANATLRNGLDANGVPVFDHKNPRAWMYKRAFADKVK